MVEAVINVIPDCADPVHDAAMHVPTLFELDAGAVREWWGRYMRGGVASALEHDTDGALPEDVFASLMAGHSRAFMAFAKDEPATGGPLGFIIVREIFIPGGKELLVWLGYHNGDDETRTADYLAQIADIAMAADCIRVTIESPRPYHRAVPGMVLARHVFHYEVR
jgi:hypothetical protein